jgi:hypothetical protein
MVIDVDDLCRYLNALAQKNFSAMGTLTGIGVPCESCPETSPLRVDGIKMQFAGPPVLSLLTVINGWLARWGSKRIIGIFAKDGAFLEYKVEEVDAGE